MDIEKIISLSTVTDNGCWEWNKSLNSSGYGQLTEGKVYWLAHRYALSCTTDFDESLIVRHLCHNTKCCNPEHLEAGLHKDNWLDSKDLHLYKAAMRRTKWSINGVHYNTSREVVSKTGLSIGSVIKYTKDGVFDIEAYHKGCIKARVTPKL